MFNGKTYIQVDGVMMGSPLGALFANIFMCEMENEIVPTLGTKLINWMRYVDDTFVFIKNGKQEEVLRKLNAYHENIRFTYELEEANGLPFLDVLVTRGVKGAVPHFFLKLIKSLTRTFKNRSSSRVFVVQDTYQSRYRNSTPPQLSI